MNNKEKMIAAVQAFQALVEDGLHLVEVEKQGDEDTLRFGLADSNGEVRAIILTDNSKYEGFGLGGSAANGNE